MLLLLWLAAAGVSVSAVAADGSGHCVLYDVCGQDPSAKDQPHRLLNCLYDGPAKKASEEDKQLLSDVCPHLMQDDLRLCCSTRQLKDLKQNFILPENLLGRCPACLANFRKNFCDLTCRPDQSLFVNVTKRVKAPGFDGECSS